MKGFIWALRHLFKGLRGIELALQDIARSQKRTLELQEMGLMAQWGLRKGTFVVTRSSEPGGESIHWVPESEEVAREVYRKTYEDMFGVKLPPYEDPPADFIAQCEKATRE